VTGSFLNLPQLHFEDLRSEYCHRKMRPICRWVTDEVRLPVDIRQLRTDIGCDRGRSLFRKCQ
jgi:hypothetical protein